MSVEQQIQEINMQKGLGSKQDGWVNKKNYTTL
jgi:hypothetical protein